MTFISKSKYLAGLQCHKLLWYHYNAKAEIPPPDEALQAIFDQGHQVGELAKTLFPGGIEVARGSLDFPTVLTRSLAAVKSRKPLFEAGFRYENAYARADVLNPAPRGSWDIVEVKSTTEVKDVNLHDLALQRYTYERAGLKIRRCILMHINKEYVRRGPVDAGQLFVQEDVTDEVDGLLPGVESKIAELIGVVRRRKEPEIRIGPHCEEPYPCPLHDMCWKSLPAHNVLTLHRFGEKGFGLLAEGVEKIVDIPGDVGLSDTQRIQQECVRRGRPHVDRGGIGEFLGGLKYPLHFLDFETFGTAIPLFDGVRPYQQVPFQFSLHVVAKPGARARHHSFLADGSTDPRPDILARLKPLLGTAGSIVSYNASFERGRIRESCEAYPEFASWWRRAESRVVDLLAPFRAFQYYHPAQEGSASMKAVLPALTGSGYDDMAISDGGAASREYLRVTFGDAAPDERQRVRRQLEEYCALDTEGMRLIVEKLRALRGNRGLRS